MRLNHPLTIDGHLKSVAIFSVLLFLAACASTGTSSYDYVRELSFQPTVQTDLPIQIKTKTVNYRYVGQGGVRYAGTVPAYVPGQKHQNYGVEGSALDVSYSFVLQSSLQDKVSTGKVETIYYGNDFIDGAVTVELVFEDVFTSFESGTTIDATMIAKAPGREPLRKSYGVRASGWVGCGACTSDDSAFRKLNNHVVKDLHDWL